MTAGTGSETSSRPSAGRPALLLGRGRPAASSANNTTDCSIQLDQQVGERAHLGDCLGPPTIGMGQSVSGLVQEPALEYQRNA
jgi:hypothetical protein